MDAGVFLFAEVLLIVSTSVFCVCPLSQIELKHYKPKELVFLCLQRLLFFALFMLSLCPPTRKGRRLLLCILGRCSCGNAYTRRIGGGGCEVEDILRNAQNSVGLNHVPTTGG